MLNQFKAIIVVDSHGNGKIVNRGIVKVQQYTFTDSKRIQSQTQNKVQ